MTLRNGTHHMTQKQVANKLGITVNQVEYAERTGLKKMGLPKNGMYEYTETCQILDYHYNHTEYTDIPWRTTDLT